MRYEQQSCVGDVEHGRQSSAEGSQRRATDVRDCSGLLASEQSSTPPQLLTLQWVRRLYVPLGERTLFRLIATGKFPKADVRIGGKLRLWRRETIEQWIVTQAESKR